MTDLAAKYAQLVSFDPATSSSRLALSRLRELILLEGLPDGQAGTELRPVVWKLLLHLHRVPASASSSVHPLLCADQYLDLVQRGPSRMFQKIRNDAFRTLATDKDFQDKVSEDTLVRVLEAFVWRQFDLGDGDGDDDSSTAVPYVQGLNVLAAPFLSVLPSELEAWACFTTFVESHAPRYVRPTLVGVHDGLQLVDECLVSLDPELYAHLARSRLSAELYAFPSILTVSAATRPLSEVVQWWDFLLAHGGVGVNVLAVVAQLVLVRDDLVSNANVSTTKTKQLVRTFPPLSARDVIPLVVKFVAELDPLLYDQVVRHPWDDQWREHHRT
ncbi:hypothetical protein JCM11491_006385 [Sporobolomyces phaffii]